MKSWPPEDGRKPEPEFAEIDQAADALFAKLDRPDPPPTGDWVWRCDETGADPG